MLDANLQSQLKTYLERVTRPIQITAHADDGAKSQEMLELLQTLDSLSDKISLQVLRDGQGRVPSFDLGTPGQDIHLTFAGLPMGHEFTSLVLALLQVGGHPSKATAELIEQVQNLEGDYRFETYFSLSCQNCPDVVQALTLMALESPRITATLIEGGTFQEEVDEREVMAVPATFLNGEPFYNGKMELAEILAKIDTGSEEKAAEKLSAKAPFEVLVVGGGPAGAATAIYTARKGFSTGIAAERFGGQLHDTLGIENLPGTPYTEGPKLAGELKRHVGEYDIDLMDLAKAVKLVPAKEEGGLHTVEFGNGASLKARSLILATGARWRNLGVPGEAEYRNKGVAYCPHCDGPLFKGKRIAVVGGGNSGVEAAIDLAKIVGHVTLIEYDDKLRADEVLQKKLRSMSNVDIVTSGQTTEITGKDVLKDRKSGAERRVELEGVFIQIGLVPNTEWLKDSGLELTKFGEIATDEEGRTNLPGVFGAGDVTDVPYKQIVVAMGEGSKAGLSAFDYLIRTEPVEDIAQAA